MSGTDKQGIRTPLARVRGLGAAHSGTTDFWHQRLTAIGMTVLIIPVLVIIMKVLGLNRSGVKVVIGSWLPATIMLLFIIACAWHMKLGMQVVIEDYVHDHRLKFVAVILNNFFAIAVAAVSAFAVLMLAFGV